MQKRIPDFFIVGAAKAGTTALYAYLQQHPQVFMSRIKEPNYFAKDINPDHLCPQVKKMMEAENISSFLNSASGEVLHRAYLQNETDYLKLFQHAPADKKAGEASASYLYSTVAAEEIYKAQPQARIIIMLREPSQRAYSHYLMDLKIGFTTRSFADALEEDRLHHPKGWGGNSLYRELGFYYEQVKRYLDIFPPEQVCILLQDDLKKNKKETLTKVFRFLGIDDEFVPDESGFKNEAAVPSGKLASMLMRSSKLRIHLRRLLKDSALKRILLRLIYKKPEQSEGDRIQLQLLKKEYAEDIRKLSSLINRDLTTWLT